MVIKRCQPKFAAISTYEILHCKNPTGDVGLLLQQRIKNDSSNRDIDTKTFVCCSVQPWWEVIRAKGRKRGNIGEKESMQKKSHTKHISTHYASVDDICTRIKSPHFWWKHRRQRQQRANRWATPTLKALATLRSHMVKNKGLHTGLAEWRHEKVKENAASTSYKKFQSE
jgi:hypothetical protein